MSGAGPLCEGEVSLVGAIQPACHADQRSEITGQKQNVQLTQRSVQLSTKPQAPVLVPAGRSSRLDTASAPRDCEGAASVALHFGVQPRALPSLSARIVGRCSSLMLHR